MDNTSTMIVHTVAFNAHETAKLIYEKVYGGKPNSEQETKLETHIDMAILNRLRGGKNG